MAWIGLSRLPFLLAGLLPYTLGAIIAAKTLGHIRWDIFSLGFLGVLLIMLSTYYAGEYWDYDGDVLSPESKFSGGTRVMLKGILSRTAPLTGSIITLALAGAVGIMLQSIYKTGPWTLPLGIVGMLGGYLYSSKPARWVETGTGELWIAFCYGWLPVAAAYYLQTAHFLTAIVFVSLPIAFSIFNVILLNEFSDHEADKKTGKNNLVVRFGKEIAARAYLFSAVLSAVGLIISTFFVPLSILWFYAPIFILSFGLAYFVFRGEWKDPGKLEILCGLNILVNILSTGAFICAFLI